MTEEILYLVPVRYRRFWFFSKISRIPVYAPTLGIAVHRAHMAAAANFNLSILPPTEKMNEEYLKKANQEVREEVENEVGDYVERIREKAELPRPLTEVDPLERGIGRQEGN